MINQSAFQGHANSTQHKGSYAKTAPFTTGQTLSGQLSIQSITCCSTEVILDESISAPLSHSKYVKPPGLLQIKFTEVNNHSNFDTKKFLNIASIYESKHIVLLIFTDNNLFYNSV